MSRDVNRHPRAHKLEIQLKAQLSSKTDVLYSTLFFWRRRGISYPCGHFDSPAKKQEKCAAVPKLGFPSVTVTATRSQEKWNFGQDAIPLALTRQHEPGRLLWLARLRIGHSALLPRTTRSFFVVTLWWSPVPGLSRIHGTFALRHDVGQERSQISVILHILQGGRWRLLLLDTDSSFPRRWFRCIFWTGKL